MDTAAAARIADIRCICIITGQVNSRYADKVTVWSFQSETLFRLSFCVSGAQVTVTVRHPESACQGMV